MTAESTSSPTPLQTLFLWALIARGGEAPNKDFRPKIEKADRAALIRLGLLAERRGPRRSVLLELTDRGWAWAAANTTARLPDRGTASVFVLADLLARLGRYLAAHDLPLAAFITPPEPPPPPPQPGDLPARIRAACLAAADGALNRQVRLAAIRPHLPDVPREGQDAALMDLVRTGAAGLLPLDDPAQITPEDAAAALVVGGQPRHLLWLRQ
jgi:hypothetical protein